MTLSQIDDLHALRRRRDDHAPCCGGNDLRALGCFYEYLLRGGGEHAWFRELRLSGHDALGAKSGRCGKHDGLWGVWRHARDGVFGDLNFVGVGEEGLGKDGSRLGLRGGL